MRSLGLVCALAFSTTVLASCGEVASPRDQWLVKIGTDGPVPQMGDRIRVELTDGNGNACNGCKRDLAANDATLYPLSFGVIRDDSYRNLRVRFFRGDHVDSADEPFPDTTIDFTGILPSAPSEITSVAVSLAMACFGIAPDGNGNSCDPGSGALALPPLLADGNVPTPGTWAPGVDVPCNGATPSGMVCIHGGALLMGDDTSFLDENRGEHLVQLSPFAIDADEMTVGAFRSVISGHPEIKDRPVVQDPSPLGDDHACEFLGDSSNANDALPVNCLSNSLALSVCNALGKDLPSEAQSEYVARNRGAQTRFPWGAAASDCAHSISGRGRYPFEMADGNGELDETCRTIQADGSLVPWGPVAGGSALDVTALGVNNLAGNLSEWMKDDFEQYTDTCWTGGLLVDPVCVGATQKSIRGGGYDDSPGLVFSANRNADKPSPGSYNLGFRCVVSMK